MILLEQKDDKRLLKSSLVQPHTAGGNSGGGVDVTMSPSNATTSRLGSMSWHRGVMNWLQQARVSTSAAATSSSSGGGPTNNNIDAASTHHRRGSSAKRRRQQQTSKNNSTSSSPMIVKASAPMTISVVTNHGLVRTAHAFVPNSVPVLRHNSNTTTTTANDVTVDCDVISDIDSPMTSSAAMTTTSQIVNASSTPAKQHGERCFFVRPMRIAIDAIPIDSVRSWYML